MIVFADGDAGELKGSARSIQGIHIRDLLARVDSLHPGLIKRFGGHAMAAGLTLAKADLERFSETLLAVVKTLVNDNTFDRQRLSDGELNATEITLPLAAQLPLIAPWGQGFAEPQFHGEFELVDFRHVGQLQDHLKLTVQLTDGRSLTAMAFKQTAPDWLTTQQTVLLRYRLDINEFRQQQSLQLLVDEVLPVSE